MRVITHVFIPGHARTKGSLTPMRRRDGSTYLSDTPASKVWRSVMARAMRDDISRRHPNGHVPDAAPVDFELTVFLPRPVNGTPDSALMPVHVSSGDLDKLLRNALDAGEDARVYLNDRQVARMSPPVKVFANQHVPVGVVIKVSALDASEQRAMDVLAVQRFFEAVNNAA